MSDPDIAPAFIACDRGSGSVRCPNHLGRDDNTFNSNGGAFICLLHVAIS
jgi:hypothetical protein